jgi:hypothetical protein
VQVREPERQDHFAFEPAVLFSGNGAFHFLRWRPWRMSKLGPQNDSNPGIFVSASNLDKLVSSRRLSHELAVIRAISSVKSSRSPEYILHRVNAQGARALKHSIARLESI